MTRLWIAAVCATLLQTQQPSQPASARWPPDGVYRIDAVDTRPTLVKEIKPVYTPDAMRARIEGIVRASCVVRAAGPVGDVGITKSLEARFGLEGAAIAALKQWVFSPASKDGTPVPVAIDVEMGFRIGDAPR